MSKSSDAFRTISEVADLLDTSTHVLRFWESKFSQIKPVKRAGGRRYYRPGDVALLAGIKKLLHDDGMTIKGAQKLLREHGVKQVGALGAQTLHQSEVEPDATGRPPAETKPRVQTTAAPEGPAHVTQSAPQAAINLGESPAAQAKTPKSIPTFPADPADSDSKAPPRLFHLLHTTSRSGLAARARMIAPLLGRMQVLRDTITTP